MIVTRSPLRISLGGGGTDLASYYEKYEGFLIAGAIDKYVYITLNQTFNQEIILKYSKMEKVAGVGEIQHSIVRACLEKMNWTEANIEITSMADIPAGTGLGSSGSFTTALLMGLHAWTRTPIGKRRLAESACDIEINRLHAPIGKQDQYAAAFGGVNAYTFHKNGEVTVEPLRISEETRYEMEENLLLFFTGYSRSANAILKEQDDQSKTNDKAMLENLHFVKELGLRSRDALETGDLNAFGAMMNEHWQYKLKRSKNMSNPRINEWYELALQNGAVGGKLIGAGGGGFLMFYASDRKKLSKALTEAGMREVRFRFDDEGTKVIAI